MIGNKQWKQYKSTKYNDIPPKNERRSISFKLSDNTSRGMLQDSVIHIYPSLRALNNQTWISYPRTQTMEFGGIIICITIVHRRQICTNL